MNCLSVFDPFVGFALKGLTEVCLHSNRKVQITEMSPWFLLDCKKNDVVPNFLSFQFL